MIGLLPIRLGRGLLAALCVLTLALPLAAAHGASARQAGDDVGVIAGTLADGTRANAPVPGVQVTLQLTLGAQAHDLTTATSDKQGHFSFDGLATGAADVYAIYTRYQGGLYSTGPLQLNSTPTQQTTLTVYDATNSDASLSISSVTLLIRQPRPTNGLIGIGEFVTMHNSGTSAYVGTTTPANGQPMGLLRFALPAGAANLTPGVGFVGSQILQVNTGFGATATVPPGDTVFAFAFDLPYDGTSAALPYKAEYPTGTLTALVPINLRVAGLSVFRAQGSGQAFGTTYQIFQVNVVPSNTSVTLQLDGLAAAGQPSDLNFRALVVLATLLGLLATLLLGLYVRRRALWEGVSARLMGARGFERLARDGRARADVRGNTHSRDGRPADAPTARLVGTVGPRDESARPTSGPPRSPEHEALLRALLALERNRAAGRLDEATFRARAAEVRASLRALLDAEEEESTVEDSASVADTRAPEIAARSPAPVAESPAAPGGAR